MAHHLADRNILFRFLIHWLVVIREALQDIRIFPLRQPSGDIGVEIQDAFLDELEDCDGRHEFGA